VVVLPFQGPLLVGTGIRTEIGGTTPPREGGSYYAGQFSGSRTRLLRRAGFEVIRTDHLFIFPRQLAFLRPLEALVSRLPIGGQYQVLARRPA